MGHAVTVRTRTDSGSGVPADEWPNFLHLARWFMFAYLPLFTLGAIAWTRLAWRYTRAGRHASMRAEWVAAG